VNTPTASFQTKDSAGPTVSMKLTCFSSFQPGSPAHMLKFFTDYLLMMVNSQWSLYVAPTMARTN